ncbi:SWIM zinc finger domain-containing protein [Ammoniphilus sp. YIM 78166]|uniref:SWIM zinc finger family protein n=1 Tax=Ammoniphilus sp. YIM 78166 TaxID=1644106 RepID=UPI00106FE2B8|nr:SWIM zinc finger family protein [Ammoniphilus sp. YIM 78166]
MINHELDKDKIFHTAEMALEAVDEVILQRGLNYYQRGKVTELWSHPDHTVEAVVQGTKSYRVFLDLNHFFNSECSCPYGVICKHIIATLCQALSAEGDPLEFFLSGNGHNASAIPFSEVEVIAEKDTTDHWLQAYEQSFSQIFSGYSYDLTAQYQRFYDKMILHAEGWSSSNQYLYRLYLLFFCLQKIEEQGSRASYANNRYVQDATRYFTKILIEDIGSPESLLTLDERREWASQLTLQMLSSDLVNVDWLTVYRFAWSHFLQDNESFQQERLRLESLWNHPSLPLLQKRTLRFALAHLELIEEHDETARRYLSPIMTAKDLEMFHFYLRMMVDEQNWVRMLEWLNWVYPYLKEASRRDLHLILRYWSLWADEHPDDERWLEVLLSLLPGSLSYYTDYLLRRQQYAAWIDFHLAEGFTPFQVPKETLKQIEGADLPALLPFYHRAVEGSIREKNRPGYKDAVRLLKKLRTYYKRLKQQERFESFISQLADRHKRLRALHEELRKGKLIP